MRRGWEWNLLLYSMKDQSLKQVLRHLVIMVTMRSVNYRYVT